MIALSCITLLALNSSLLCTTCTLVANFVRKVASSIAESPPPTTINSKFLKNGPSHVAQYDTPFPENSSSPSIPIFFGFAPVAIITARPSYSSEPVKTLYGARLKSTSTAISSIIVVPIL